MCLFLKVQMSECKFVRSHHRPPLTPVCYWPAQEPKSPWPMYYLYLHPSPAFAAEYLNFLTHGQSNTASRTSHMCYCTLYLPIPWPEYRLHVRATKLLLVLAVEKLFCKFHFLWVEGGEPGGVSPCSQLGWSSDCLWNEHCIWWCWCCFTVSKLHAYIFFWESSKICKMKNIYPPC